MALTEHQREIRRARYRREYEGLMDKIRAIFGEKCQRCGTTKNLQLHHKYYAPDSIRPTTHNENGFKSFARKKEAILHPERFMLLCLSCHNVIEPHGICKQWIQKAGEVQ